MADRFPHDFGLAGGSFRTRAIKASCRRPRRLTAFRGEPRGDVGLRLIRFRLADEDRRWIDPRRLSRPLPPRPQRT